MTAEFHCTECNAPLHAWEYGRHQIDCIRIRLAKRKDTSSVAQRDQLEAHQRELDAGRHGRTSMGPQPPVQKPHPSMFHKKPTPPPGKTECHWCSELDYQQCVNCDGKGWV